MLDACGVDVPGSLVRPPARGGAAAETPGPAAGHFRIRNCRLLPPARRGKRQRLRVVSGRRRLPPFPPGAGGCGGLARRVSDLLHALPGGDLAGHAHHHLRIPDHDLPAHRHGRGQRLHVRRLHRRAGSRHDGRAPTGQAARAGGPFRAPRVPRSAAHLRPEPGHAGGGIRLPGRMPGPSTWKTWNARWTMPPPR